MHPLGCFGSTLAFTPKSKVCSSCPKQDECRGLVEARHATFLNVLDRFGDGKGGTMAERWRPKTTRKDRARQTVLNMLSNRPHTMKELVAGVTVACAYSASTAQRETYEQVQSLTSQNRAQRVGKAVELK